MLLLAALCLAAGAARAADQKLILKDGTDHLIRTYEIKSDRVRYYSTEREDWEELPVSLVDWEATERANKEAEEPPDVELEPGREPEPVRFTVASGVVLPDGEGVYVYDGTDLLRLEQLQATVRNDTARSILGAVVPGIKGRAWIELEGRAATITVSGPKPDFYLQLSKPSPAGYGLVRADQKDGSRVVGEILVSAFTKGSSEKRNLVPSESQTVRPGSGPAPGEDSPAVIRLSPTEELTPGEYAVIEFLEPEKANLFVWDFGYYPKQSGDRGQKSEGSERSER